MRHKINHIHFIGIGGVGMSGIAEVLLNLNYKISGSDIKDSPTIKRLQSLGTKIYIGHHEQNILEANVVVVSKCN